MRWSVPRALFLAPVLISATFAPMLGCGGGTDTANPTPGGAGTNGAVAQPPAGAQAGTPQAGPTRPAPTDYTEPRISNPDCLEFSRQRMETVHSANVPGIQKFIDWQAMLETSLTGLPISDAQRNEFVAQFTASEHTYLGEIARQVAQGGDYKPLHLFRIESRPQVVFRFLPPMGTEVEYHQFELRRSADGKLRINDAYVYRTAERLTEVFRRTSVLIFLQNDPEFINRLAGAARAWVDAGPQLKQLDDALAAGDPSGVLGAHAEIPNALRGKLTLLVSCARAASLMTDLTALDQVYADISRLHPEDPATKLLAIEYHAARGQWAEGLAAIDRFDQAVEGDPFLNVRRAEMLIALEDLDKASAVLRAGIRQEATLSDAYWMLIDIALAQHDHASTLDGLRALDSQFEIDWVDLRQEPNYAEFVKSPQYNEWLGYLQARYQPGQGSGQPAAEVGALPTGQPQ